ncbi:MAG TPA: AMP-binding protein [Pyrinomonadaceae bacterium]|jgi:acyl-CoA synthetase (AMP-forming)/AMP-acid ligase II|nr:AMP-binding protein [Pyrinomonadaceae bacterium]
MFESGENLHDDRATLGRVLQRRLEEEPEATASWLVDSEGKSARVTVRALVERAYAFAARYGSVREGRKIVAVCLYHGLDLHAAFVGALLAGHIPTMIAPPSPRMESAKYTDSFCRMLAHIRPSCVVADGAALEKLDALALKDFPDSELIDAKTVRDSGLNFETWEGDAEEVALLQHSSGTTGLQKGVALSHRAVLRHNRAYAERVELTREDVIVSWLPLYHDMGFVACFLLPLLSRVPFVELSPFDWVLRPASLFEQIQKHRATLCWMPNFAFQFMADSVRPSQVAGLSLASVRAWVNCSEPVQHSAHASFLERFAEQGVSETQLTASYAMAENVFAVTQSRAGEYRVLGVNRRLFREEHRVETDESEGALAFVSNGTPVEGTEVAVIDERGRAIPEGGVGELAIRGDYLFSGYFRREDLTREALTAEGWYKTGDLGFVREGEVYVTGRKKDLIIVQGRNFYPADVEKVVASVEGVTPGRVVVFGLANEKTGTEGLIVLAESEEFEGERARRLSLRIRNAVAQELDCTPQDVRVVPPRWLVKSTAGKLARADNRSKYLKNVVKLSGTSPAYV